MEMTTLEELERLLAAKGPSDWAVIWDAPNLAIGAGTYRVVQTPNQNNYGHYGSSQRWLGIESVDQANLIVAAINALPGLLESARRVERLEAENADLRQALSSLVDRSTLSILARHQFETLLKGT